jgi:outer membrane protein assembly factor BamA
MERKEVRKMTKKLFVFFLALAVVAFSLSVLAQNIVQGKVEAIDKVAKRITISGTEYILSNEAARIMVKVGDQVVATVEGNIVQKLQLLM